jgi:hypothetical protein
MDDLFYADVVEALNQKRVFGLTKKLSSYERSIFKATKTFKINLLDRLVVIEVD